MIEECSFGSCTQDVFSGDYCYYHSKLVGGLLDPSDEDVWDDDWKP